MFTKTNRNVRNVSRETETIKGRQMTLLDLKIQYLNKNNHMGLKAGQKMKEEEVSDLKSDLVT